MKILMLQRLNPQTFDNEGGLYINQDHISALIPIMRIDKVSGERHFYTNILLSNSIQYLTPFNVQEIYEMTLK